MTGPGTTVRVGAPSVRPAEQRDVPRIAATLTLALAESRWTRWALPEDGRIQRLTRLHELDAGHRSVATGTGWVTEDVTAVATWEAPAGEPGTHPLPGDVRAALVRELPYLAGANAGRVADTRALVDAARPAASAAVPTWAAVRFLRGSGFEVDRAMRTADDALPLWLVVRRPGS